jgi:hypothetical protein
MTQHVAEFAFLAEEAADVVLLHGAGSNAHVGRNAPRDWSSIQRAVGYLPSRPSTLRPSPSFGVAPGRQ